MPTCPHTSPEEIQNDILVSNGQRRLVSIHICLLANILGAIFVVNARNDFVFVFAFYSQITKLQNMITYPLYDLDVSEFIPFKDQNTCYLYDLYGIVVSTHSFLL